MKIEEIKEIIYLHKRELEKKYKVKKIAIFGSFARGEQKEESDIDLLVEFEEEGKTFDNYMELKFFLEDLLNKKIDLVMKDALKDSIKELIMKELEYV